MNNEDLMNIAKNAMKNAYAPYSKYHVGAALLAKSGTVYIGTNIEENSIPGLSNCAERVAFQNAISHGEREFQTIAIAGANMDAVSVDKTLVPCGVCLQFIQDMAKNIDIIVYINGVLEKKKISDFLSIPYEFLK